eukprot:CAMPEP_0202688382 /NCGR_PEP_ID=MMETSP1385-20130828/3902_1 /ASSEMBLY_ACC=CAM_ASM_000861 /TAXON_ID=933848 /ORGANISM="Elphidium margaritaceum" /LENGTH=465 /DNA_ID=CAMNT_0049343347 /DNA_START=117 /DNA_END=1514 /DNA_ORIENTATION=+
MTKINVDAFREKVLIPRKFDKPVHIIDGFSFLFIRVGSIYVVCSTGMNGNASLIFQFLYDLVDIFRSYFDGKFDEESFRQNFTLIYELLDEVMDNGYPQITSSDILQEYIKTTNKDVSLRARLQRLALQSNAISSNNSNASNGSSKDGKSMQEITAAITGRMDWRAGPASSYQYPKNEVYLDVIEDVNLLMSRTGEVLQMNASGRVAMKTMLSGMPEARIGINDKLCVSKSSSSNPNANTTSNNNAHIIPHHDASKNKAAVGKQKGTNYIHLNDIKLHRCVRLGKFDQDRSILFVPPDGDFELMRYSVSNLTLPFYVYPNIVERGTPGSTTRVVYDIRVESKFNSSWYATDVLVLVPTPENTHRCNIKVNNGKTQYQPTAHCIKWRIKKIYGGQSVLLKGEVELTRLMVEREWARPPIKMQFQVRMLAASGMKIRYLKITENTLNYKTSKWVRYITNAGSYQIRI